MNLYKLLIGVFGDIKLVSSFGRKIDLNVRR